jgi:hypothetical protein
MTHSMLYDFQCLVYIFLSFFFFYYLNWGMMIFFFLFPSNDKRKICRWKQSIKKNVSLIEKDVVKGREF